ncbi:MULTISPECIES: GNAT family N-acetyltransferase [Bacillus]|uniref:GNAT family N-acetyltransferase n=1 Tax=Bacillus TaxID=1386 RepID=UPI001D0D14D9|nr:MULTISPECIES: GNAT family N-acetyltransferase [Bacillus]
MLKFIICKSMPDSDLLNAIVDLHADIFGTTDDLINKMCNKPRLLINIAMDGKKVIGYKIGYELDNETFYSWLGGVDSTYRNQGIASILMEKQHDYLKEQGYKVVQTKTMNKWRNMLILNIKHGFDVIETYTNERGLHKIILEKNLLEYL